MGSFKPTIYYTIYTSLEIVNHSLSICGSITLELLPQHFGHLHPKSQTTKLKLHLARASIFLLAGRG